jgi:hypothetical protein
VSHHLIVLLGAIGLLAACSDTTGPNASAVPATIDHAPLPHTSPLPPSDECSPAGQVVRGKALARTVIASVSDAVPLCTSAPVM